MRRSFIASLSFAAAAALTACGDDGGGSSVDARMVGSDAPVMCAADTSYPTVAPIDPIATRTADTNPDEMYYYGSLNMDFDDLGIELYKGYGAFEATEIVAKPITLTGDETAFETCGACVLIYANTNLDTGDSEMIYLATGGTLNLTSVSPKITGTLLDATLQHVTLDDEGASHIVNDGCTATIASFSFDTMVTTEEPKAFAPKAKRHPRQHR